MAETLTFVAELRKANGTRGARKLRKQGMVPAVLYGHKEATVPLVLPVSDLEKAIRHGTRVVDLKADGKTEKALIREVQWDHLGKELLHVDFARVGADEKVIVSVPIEIRGTAPGISSGGVLDQPLHTLSVECLAISLPESIRVNVNELQLGSAIHVKDLHLPPGVRAMVDPETIVVHVTQKQVEAEAGAVPGVAPEQAEPEVIGRQKTEEEEAE